MQVIPVALTEIKINASFRLREGRNDRRHRDQLAAQILRTNRPLDPVLLWRDEAEPAGSLVLLDGEYRINAYKRAKWSEPVPACIVVCDRRTAQLEAARAGSKAAMPLTQGERLNAAWRLVYRPMEPRYTVPEVSKAAGVSRKTVDNMRRRLRDLSEEGKEITGDWHRDRQTISIDEPPASLTEAQRCREIEKLTEEIRDLLDRRKRKDLPILGDAGAVDEAILKALGEKRIEGLYDYLHGEDDEFDYAPVGDDEGASGAQDYAF